MARWFSILSLALVTAACGGSTNSGSGGAAGSGATGGSSGNGGGGSGGVSGTGASSGAGGLAGTGGGSGGMPPECQVGDVPAGPYPTTFKFVNTSATPLYLRSNCRLAFQVTTCADGYGTPLSLWADCTTPCSDPTTGCIACGACPNQPIQVTPTQPTEVEWSGMIHTFSQNAEGCSCYDEAPAPAGTYKVSVDVYGSEQGMLDGTPLYTIPLPFHLPANSGVVEVPIAAQGDSQ